MIIIDGTHQYLSMLLCAMLLITILFPINYINYFFRFLDPHFFLTVKKLFMLIMKSGAQVVGQTCSLQVHKVRKQLKY